MLKGKLAWKKNTTGCDSCDEYQLCVEEETPFMAMSNVHPLPCHLVTLQIVEGVLCQCVADEMRNKYEISSDMSICG